MSEVVHLIAHEDREESEAYCSGRFEYPNTRVTSESTCGDCLRAARDYAENLAAECDAQMDRLDDIEAAARFPQPPVEPGPPIRIVADPSCPPDRIFMISGPLRVTEDGRYEADDIKDHVVMVKLDP